MQNTIKTEEVDGAEVVVENTLNTTKIEETAAVGIRTLPLQKMRLKKERENHRCFPMKKRLKSERRKRLDSKSN